MLVKRRVEGQYRAVTEVFHQVHQRFCGIAARRNGAGANAVDQHAGAEFYLRILQGAFELLAKIDGPVLDRYRANRQHMVLVQVQPGGFQIEHHPALLTQAAFAQGGSGWQAFQAMLQVGGQGGARRTQP
ncbi:hypothetical protein D3C84_910720 [compost metagenome]